MLDSDPAVAEVPAVDVWAFAQDKNPSLDALVETKRAVLGFRPLRLELEKRLTGSPATPVDKRNEGIARWMLAQYHRAYPLLKEAGGGGQTMTYLLAECCLKAEVVEGGQRSMRRPDIAAKLLSKHDKVDSDLRVWALWCDALLFDEDREGLAAALKKVPSGGEGGADHLYFLGRVAEWDGDLDLASAKYEEALSKDPEHEPSLFRTACLADRFGDDDGAVAIYKKLAERNPANIHVVLNLGVLHEDADRFDEALACYRRVVDEFPNHRRAVRYLKDAEASLNQVVEEEHERAGDRAAVLLRTPVADFDLSPRARTCLQKLEVHTFGDLVAKSESDITAQKSFGEAVQQEIRALVSTRGFRFGYGTTPEKSEEDLGDLIDVPDSALPLKGPVPIPAGIEPRVLSIQLADMELPLRVRKALVAMKAMNIGDLLTHTEAELLSLKNFGLTSLNELKAKLAEYGVGLRAS